jgi:hypothetical protein
VVLNDTIYLLTAIGLSPGGSSTVNIYTQTIHRTTQKLGRVRAMPRLCELYPVISLTTEEKARKTLSQGKIPYDVTSFVSQLRQFGLCFSFVLTFWHRSFTFKF